ncbi:MAG: S9 family peptidase [Gammaproteobacteria bacterium]|nr:S9 family peptidase [Gammaproteobacteria bacterium]
MCKSITSQEKLDGFYSYTLYYHINISFEGDEVFVIHNSNDEYFIDSYSLCSNRAKALICSSKYRYYQISKFPFGPRLVYEKETDCDDHRHVFIKDEDGLELDLTSGHNVKSSFLGWNRNGREFWVASNKRTRKEFDVYSYRASDYQSKLIFENRGQHNIEVISPDGSWLATKKLNSHDDASLHLISLKSGAETEIPRRNGSASVRKSCISFTPDSEQLIYLTDEHSEFKQAWYYDITNRKYGLLFELNWDIEFIKYSKSMKYYAVGYNCDGIFKLKLIDNTSNSEVSIPETDLDNFSISQAEFTNDELYLVLILESDTVPSTLAYLDLSSHKKVSFEQLSPSHLVEPKLVQSIAQPFNSYDQLLVRGHLYKPQNASDVNKCPVLIWIHGGPGGQFRPIYRPEIQVLVNEGIAVFGVNHRGSSGYGKAFYHAADKKHGEADLKDIVSAKHFLQSITWVDPERIGVIGVSYGGYLAMAGLTFTDEFQVGIDFYGVMNWSRALSSIPEWWETQRQFIYSKLGNPAHEQEKLESLSPVFHTEKITQPTMIVQGAKDQRTLKIESDEMASKLLQQNVPVEYLLFDDEGHGIRKRHNKIKLIKTTLFFLQKYL